MIKILSKDQIREADRYTVAHEPVATIDLMERAAESCLAPVCSRISPSTVIRIFCGPGNNGGDGLALARMLYMRGYSVVVYGLGEPSRFSSDRSVNTERFTEIAGERYVQVRELLDVPVTGKGECWVDALFGTGNSSAPAAIFRSVIDRINSSGAFVVSIDLPSGLDAAAPAQDPDGVVRAAMTLSFQSPKLAFLIPDTGRFAGEWIITDIGLHPQFLQNVATDTFFFTAHDANDLFKRREKFSHKGTFGHALLFAGSHGTTGAAVLASRACLRSGVGLLTTHVPAESVQILQTAAPEAMVSTDADAKFITGFTGDFARFSAIGIGPGIGTSTATADLLLKVLASGSPLVVDADALNILSADKRLLDLIPKGTVLTPHPKEFERLTQPVGDGFERLRLQREFARKYSVTVVLKGSHTCTVTPDGTAYFNSTGNAGLARGGSGDILTGMILSFLSQGYPPEDAARLGVYLHGAAADAVASRTSMQGMLPSDVVEQLPRTFGDLEESAGDPLRYRS